MAAVVAGMVAVAGMAVVAGTVAEAGTVAAGVAAASGQGSRSGRVLPAPASMAAITAMDTLITAIPITMVPATMMVVMAAATSCASA